MQEHDDENAERDEDDISAVNLAIDVFFAGCRQNQQKVAWFSPSVRRVPDELREIATSLTDFFSGKKWHCGGPIYTKINFRLINNITLTDAIQLGYAGVARGKSLATGYYKDAEIDISLRVLRECQTRRISRDHAGGLFCLYLELCEKVELPQ